MDATAFLVKQLNEVLDAKELCYSRLNKGKLCCNSRKKIINFLNELDELEKRSLNLLLKEQLLIRRYPKIIND